MMEHAVYDTTDVASLTWPALFHGGTNKSGYLFIEILCNNLSSLPYKDRLKYLNLLSLYYRRLQEDMVMTYKVLTGRTSNPLCLHYHLQ